VDEVIGTHRLCGVMIDLTGRLPTWPDWLRAAWLEALEKASWTPSAWDTPRTRGEPDLLAVLAEELGVDGSRVMITPGVRATVMPLCNAKRAAFIEQPTFSGVAELIERTCARTTLGSWSMLGEFARNTESCPDLIWVTSPARNPDGLTLSPALTGNLDHLVELGTTVVVNEIYRWYTPAQGPSKAVRVGSLSKLAGGGARLGWIIDCPDDVMALQRLGPPTQWQRAWGRLLTQVGFGRLRGALIAPAARASLAFTGEVSDCLQLADAAAGPSILLALNNISEESAVDLFKRAELAVGAGRHFRSPAAAVRLSFSSVTERDALEAGRRVARLARRNPGMFGVSP
jgi:DNA-binding transcriptional MocR family regulator